MMINDEFSGIKAGEEPPIKTEKRNLKVPNGKLDSDINIFVENIKSRNKQIDKMMNNNVDKENLFGQSIAAETKVFPKIEKAPIKMRFIE